LNLDTDTNIRIWNISQIYRLDIQNIFLYMYQDIYTKRYCPTLVIAEKKKKSVVTLKFIRMGQKPCNLHDVTFGYYQDRK